MKKNFLFNKLYVILSLFYFKLIGKSFNNTSQALVNIYSKDGGLFMDKLHKLISSKKKIILDNVNNDLLIKKITDNGYEILNYKINKDEVSELKKFAFKSKCFDGNSNKYFDENNLTSVRYDFDKNDLINNKTVQNLVKKDFFIDIARNYFNSEPIFDLPAMWWSTPFKKEASSEAAQLYHYDCNGRVKWLKIFVYLTNVDENNGPHHYIKKSHKVGSKPQEILSRGYVRVSDEEMKKFYPSMNF